MSKGCFQLDLTLAKRLSAISFLSIAFACANAQELTWIKAGHLGVHQVVASPVSADLFSTGAYRYEIKRWSGPGHTFDHTWFDPTSLHVPVTVAPSHNGDFLLVVGGEVSRRDGELTYYSLPDGQQLYNFRDDGFYYAKSDLARNDAFILLGAFPNGGSHWRILRKSTFSSVTDMTYRQPSDETDNTFNAVQVAPDCQSFVSCSDELISFWRIDNPKPIQTLPIGATCAAFSDDGRFLATGDRFGAVTLWDYSSRRPIRKLIGQPALPLKDIKFDAVTGNLLAICQFYDQTAHLMAWNVSTSSLVFGRKIDCNDLTSIAIPPSGDSIFTGGGTSGVLEFNRFTGAPVRSLTSDLSQGSQIAFTGDSAQVASTSLDNVRMIDSATGDIAWSRDVENHGALAFSPTGSSLVCGDGHSVKVLDKVSGLVTHEIPGTGDVTTAAFSPDGRLLAVSYQYSGSTQADMTVWETSTWQQVFHFRLGFDVRGGMAFTPDGSKLLVSLDTGYLHAFNTATWFDTTLIRTDFNDNSGCEFALSPDGQFVAMNWFQYPDQAVKVYRLSNLSLLYTIPSRRPSDMEFSPDGKMLWVADDHLYAYDASSGAQVFVTTNPEARWVGRIAISPDNGYVGFDRWDGTEALFKNPLR